jgi:hypothetical protein
MKFHFCELGHYNHAVSKNLIPQSRVDSSLRYQPKRNQFIDLSAEITPIQGFSIATTVPTVSCTGRHVGLDSDDLLTQNPYS